MTIRRFRKKLIVIEAVQWTGQNTEECRKFTMWDLKDDTPLCLQTLGGTFVVFPGDWIIKHSSSSYSILTPAQFAEDYEEVIG